MWTAEEVAAGVSWDAKLAHQLTRPSGDDVWDRLELRRFDYCARLAEIFWENEPEWLRVKGSPIVLHELVEQRWDGRFGEVCCIGHRDEGIYGVEWWEGPQLNSWQFRGDITVVVP